MAVGDLSFAFSPDRGETPETVAKKRMLAEAIMGKALRSPKDIGEGLSSIGQAIMYRKMMGDTAKAETEGRSGAAKVFESIFGGGFPAAPAAPGGMGGGASAAAAHPVDPNVGSTIDFARGEASGGDLAPHQTALLDTIAGPESAGAYDVMYGGSKFSDFSDHPRRAVPIETGPNAGKTSSAAGKYQFLGSTWDQYRDKLGLQDFSPKSQDKAAWALASDTYKAETGQDLDAVLQSGNPEAIAQVGNVLSGIWTSLPGGIEQGTNTNKFVTAYQGALGRGASPAEAANEAMAGTQVASMDPSIGMPPPQQAARTGGLAAFEAQGLQSDPSAAPTNSQVQAWMRRHTPSVSSPRRVAQAFAGDAGPADAGADYWATRSGPGLQQLIQAASDPWMNPGQRAVLNSIIQQQMQASDPMRQLQMERERLELEALKNPTSEYGFMELPDGTVIKTDPRTGDVAEAFRGQPKPKDLPAAVQEYEYAKEQGFPGTFQDWEASKKGGMSLSVDPATGAVTFQQGANMKPLTEGQSKDTVFSTRAAGALPIIDEFGDALTSLPETLGGQVPVAGNFMKSPEFQQAEQAGKEFLQAILRKDTGAAITAEETSEYGSVYLPRPGDTPELLAQKKASRIRALEAIKAGMPAQAILAQEKALENTGMPQPIAPKQPIIIDGYTIEEVE